MDLPNVSAEGDEAAALFQVSFFSNDENCTDFLPGDSSINVPALTESEQLNLLINKLGSTYNENWEPVAFDFLIDSVLLRSSLLAFVDTYHVSLEDGLRIECIRSTPAPRPLGDQLDSDWVADLKAFGSNCIMSVNYGGELVLWKEQRHSSSATAKKLFRKMVVKKMGGEDNNPLKCVDVFKRGDKVFALVGAQNQTLTLLEVIGGGGENSGQKPEEELTPIADFRGHQRSVECVAANAEGTYAISGSFDKCLKVWRLDEEQQQEIETTEGERDAQKLVAKKANKRARHSVKTMTPLVTLKSHREAIVDACWHPRNAGQAVTVSWDQQMLVWDLQLAGPVSILTLHKAFTSVAIGPLNGLALSGASDAVIRMWDLRSNEGSMVKATYLGHMGWVSDVCWCPNNEHLFVSASYDNTVKMWDIRSPKAALYDLMGHEDRVLCVDWSRPEWIGSGSADRTMKVFGR